MTKNRKTKSVLTVSILLSILGLLACTAGCSQPGRYQLVENVSNPFVIDTVTGQAWPRTSGMLRSPKPGHSLPGQTGRFEGVVIGSENYIIDTTTGKVYPPGTGMFQHRKK